MPNARPKQYRVTLADAIAAHERALQFGGRAGISDLGLVESAIARPYSGYYPKVHQKAAALLHAVATNHGFIDGNKRTAFYLTLLYLELSGYSLIKTSSLAKEDDLEHLILDAVTKFLDLDEITAWLKKRINWS